MAVKRETIGRMEEISSEGVTWINIEKPTHDVISTLGQRYSLHKLDLEDCLSKIQLTKVDQYEDYLFIILHFPVSSSNGQAFLSSQISIFLGENYLVTVHQGDLKPLMETFQTCRSDDHRRQALMNRGSGHLLYRLIDSLVDELFPTLDRVMRDLDAVEDEVFDEKIEAVRKVTVLRRKIASLRRIVSPHRRVIPELATRAQRFAKDDLSVYFSNISDHVEKVWETLEECKETVDIYKDTDFMLNAEKTNKILAVLTILFTLSIPATVIATYYGMNIILPGGLATEPWTFFGPYTTLLFILTASTVPAILLAWYFHRLGWF